MKYTVITYEPGFPGSDETQGQGLGKREALKLWFSLRRKYLSDRENNPSYGEIEGDGEVVFNGHFGAHQDFFQATEIMAEHC